MTKLLTIQDVSTLTGWKPRTIYQKVWKREIPFLKLGRSVRFKEEAIRKLLDGGENPPKGSGKGKGK